MQMIISKESYLKGSGTLMKWGFRAAVWDHLSIYAAVSKESGRTVLI